MSGNPKVKSKGDYHGKPRKPEKAGPVPNPEPSYPPAKEVPAGHSDTVKGG